MSSKRSLVQLLTAGLISACSWLAHAQSASRPSPPPLPPGATAPVGMAVPAVDCTASASSVTRMSCELALGLGPAARGALIVAAPLRSDREAPRAAELTAAIARLVAGQLGGGARAATAPASLPEARSMARLAGIGLVFVEAVISDGMVRITAELRSRPRSFWRRVGGAAAASVARAFSEQRLDPEIASFLAAIPLVISRRDHAPASHGPGTAVACGDSDMDGSLELVVVDRHELRWSRLRGGETQTFARLLWRDAVAVAPRPLREPITAAFVMPSGGVAVGSTDRAEGLELGTHFTPDRRLPGLLPWPGVGCLAVRADGLAAPRPCGDQPADLRVDVEAGADAIASALVSNAEGQRRWIVAWRQAGTSFVTLADDRGRRATLEGSGAQLALGDLDLDGEPELLSSVDTLDPRRDALRVHTWRGSGALVERASVPFPSGIRALATCPAGSGTLSAIAIATSDGLWVLQ